MEDHRAPTTLVVVVPSGVHTGDFIATSGILPTLARVGTCLCIKVHLHHRAVTGLPSSGRGHAANALSARADVSHRAAHTAIFPHHLNAAVAVRKRTQPSRALHIKLLRDVTDVFAVGAHLAGITKLRPDFFALPKRLIISSQHQQNGPRRIERKARPRTRRAHIVREFPPVITDEPRHRFRRRRRCIALRRHTALCAVRRLKHIMRSSDPLAKFSVTHGIGGIPTHRAVAALEPNALPMRLHVRIELALQSSGCNHVRSNQWARHLSSDLDCLPTRLRNALAVILKRREFLRFHIHFDRRVIF